MKEPNYHISVEFFGSGFSAQSYGVLIITGAELLDF